MTQAALLTTHLIGACLWIGGMFFALFIFRPAAAPLAPPDRLATHGRALGRFFPAVWVLIVLTLGSGFGLIVTVYGGFALAPLPIHLMAGGGLLMAAIFAILWFGPFRALKRGLQTPGEGNPAQILGQIRRLVLTNFCLGLLMIVCAGWARMPA